MFFKSKKQRPQWEVMADDGMNKFLKFVLKEKVLFQNLQLYS